MKIDQLEYILRVATSLQYGLNASEWGKVLHTVFHSLFHHDRVFLKPVTISEEILGKDILRLGGVINERDLRLSSDFLQTIDSGKKGKRCGDNQLTVHTGLVPMCPIDNGLCPIRTSERSLRQRLLFKFFDRVNDWVVLTRTARFVDDDLSIVRHRYQHVDIDYVAKLCVSNNSGLGGTIIESYIRRIKLAIKARDEEILLHVNNLGFVIEIFTRLTGRGID